METKKWMLLRIHADRQRRLLLAVCFVRTQSSLTAVPYKILEHIVFHDIMTHLNFNNILVNSQHGFRRKFSCETQLITTIGEIAKALENGKRTDLILMDSSKAFDVVPHQRLIHKLDYYGIRGHLKDWLTSWLTCREQSVVVGDVSSLPVHVSSGVPTRNCFWSLDVPSIYK